MAMGATVIDRDLIWTAERTAGSTTFSTSGWLTVFEKFAELRDADCFNRPLGTSEDVARSLIASGRALGFFGPSSAFKIIQEMTDDELVFTAFPATNDPSETLLCVGVGSGLSGNSATEHPEEVRKFLAFMMEPENTAVYASTTGQVPATPNDVYQPDNAATQFIVEQIAAGKTAPLTNQLWPNPTIVPEQRKLTQMMLGEEATPQDITEAMDAAWGNGG
jgi:raffinose/stachyose/melibiose transport system substrate-binding protein